MVSKVSFSSTCLSSSHEPKTLVPRAFKSCAALRSACVKRLHFQKVLLRIEVTPGLRTNFLIPEKKKHSSSSTSRLSLNRTTAKFCLRLNASLRTVVTEPGNVYVSWATHNDVFHVHAHYGSVNDDDRNLTRRYQNPVSWHSWPVLAFRFCNVALTVSLHSVRALVYVFVPPAGLSVARLHI